MTGILDNPEMPYLALGILGTMVLPRNLHLHSGIVQTRAFGVDPAQKRETLRHSIRDSTIALMPALLVNSSILILAASTFDATGNTGILGVDEAHARLSPLLGGAMAPTLFGIAPLCCGLHATLTATLSGQMVKEGFIAFRISAVLRQPVTRTLARMGDLVAPCWLTAVCALIAVVLITLNVNLLWSMATGGF